MSYFLTDLDVRWVTRDTSEDKRGTRRLLAPLVFRSERLGRLIEVPAGFITDFASVPRIPVAFLLAGAAASEAAVLHDFLYSTRQVSRKDADAVFFEAASLGEPAWRAWLMWAAVRVGGVYPYYKMRNQDQPEHVLAQVPELEAP